MQFNIWNLIYLSLMILTLGIYLAKHGQKRDGNYNFWHGLISAIIYIFILYKGGFFN